MKRLLAVPLLALAFADAGAQRAQRAQLVARLDSAFRNNHDGATGAARAVAIVRGSDVLLIEATGLADRETARAATPHTIFEIGSLTKQVTAAAIMRLAEQGKVDVDADISRYLPEFPLQGHRVAVRNLLNHTSGIHNYTNGEEWMRHWGEELAPATVAGFVARDTFDFAPGTKYGYSNTAYTLLGMIIEKVSGKPYASFVEQELFQPLGLEEMRYCPSRTSDTLFAKGYRVSNGQSVPATFLSMTIPYSAGAICASVSDYVQWQRAFYGGRVVSAASYTRMTTPDTLANGSKLNYGFGLSVGLLGGHPAAMHGGEVNGFTAAQIYLPKDSVGVVVFTNDQTQTPEILTVDLARMVIGVPLTGRGALDRPQ